MLPIIKLLLAAVIVVPALLAQSVTPTPTATPPQPTIAISPAHPSDYADLTITFPGTPPKNVTVVALMTMGGIDMHSPTVTMTQGSDPHVFTGRVDFSIDGTWTLHVIYDGNSFDQQIEVGS